MLLTGIYPHYLYLIKEILPVLRSSHLEFNPHIKEAVTESLQKLKEQYKNQTGILFIGVHIRTKDSYALMFNVSYIFTSYEVELRLNYGQKWAFIVLGFNNILRDTIRFKC